MKIFLYEECRMLYMATILSFILMTGALAHADKKSSDKADGKEKIRISAETLTSDMEAKYAEFIGNVRATQGNTVITCDKLKVFYNDQPNDEKKSVSGEGSIKKILAEGNVRIILDDKTAEAAQAVYTTNDKILTLSGENSKVSSGSSFFSGSKIIFYRTDGRIRVEGNRKKQVEVELYPGGSGIE